MKGIKTTSILPIVYNSPITIFSLSRRRKVLDTFFNMSGNEGTSSLIWNLPKKNQYLSVGRCSQMKSLFRHLQLFTFGQFWLMPPSPPSLLQWSLFWLTPPPLLNTFWLTQTPHPKSDVIDGQLLAYRLEWRVWTPLGMDSNASTFSFLVNIAMDHEISLSIFEKGTLHV